MANVKSISPVRASSAREDLNLLNTKFLPFEGNSESFCESFFVVLLTKAEEISWVGLVELGAIQIIRDTLRGGGRKNFPCTFLAF